MRDAFGIKEDFPEGSSFKEEHQKQRREAEKLEREAKYKEKEKQRRRWKFDFLEFIVIKVKVKPTGNLSTLYPTLRMLEPKQFSGAVSSGNTWNIWSSKDFHFIENTLVW